MLVLKSEESYERFLWHIRTLKITGKKSEKGSKSLQISEELKSEEAEEDLPVLVRTVR